MNGVGLEWRITRFFFDTGIFAPVFFYLREIPAFVFSQNVVSKRLLFRKLLQFVSKCALMPRDPAYVVILPSRKPQRLYGAVK